MTDDLLDKQCIRNQESLSGIFLNLDQSFGLLLWFHTSLLILGAGVFLAAQPLPPDNFKAGCGLWKRFQSHFYWTSVRANSVLMMGAFLCFMDSDNHKTDMTPQ